MEANVIMPDAIPFATDAWIKRLGEECNKSAAYREAARKWEGDLYVIVEPEGRLQETVYMYLDLYHGQCRQAFVPADHTSMTPEFYISGPVSVWKAIAEKRLDPMKALFTRQITLKGNMAKVLKNVKAANELVNCTTTFETEFPLD
jgi:putative sterol carrier protein